MIAQTAGRGMQIHTKPVAPSPPLSRQRPVRQWGGPERSFLSGRAQGSLLTPPSPTRSSRIQTTTARNPTRVGAPTGSRLAWFDVKTPGMGLVLTLVASAGLFPVVVTAQTARSTAPPSPTWPDAASSPTFAAEPALPAAPPPPTSPGGPSPPAAATPRRLAILAATITPFALPWELFERTGPNLPIVALSLEFRAHPRVGIAVMGLAGDDSDTGFFVNSHQTFFEIGAEPRWYWGGGFRGWMAGIAVHYFRIHADLTDVTSGDIQLFDFAGYTYGPFVGYKYTAEIGFTVDAKVGIGAVKRTMSDAGSYRDVIPMTDVKVGWSF